MADHEPPGEKLSRKFAGRVTHASRSVKRVGLLASSAAFKQWLWIVTALLIIASMFIFQTSETLEDAARKADFLAGISAALAFLWLVAGFRLQSREIAIQREELHLQRIAIEQQKK
jgi:hypothetical protein